MITHHDEEHTSLTAAVAALGDDAGRAPSIDEIAAQRRREAIARAADVIRAAIEDRRMPGTRSYYGDLPADVITALEAAGLTIVQRRPE